MNNLLKSSVFILLLAALFLTGCNEIEGKLVNGDKHITAEIDEAISDYIIEKYSSSYPDTDKQFEVHRVYGTSESEGVLSVYMWSYYSGFNKSTGLESQAGHSLPAVIRLRNEGENYSVIEYLEPQDGSYYLSSLEEMFPKKYVRLAKKDSGNIEDLQKEMDLKVKQWLEEPAN
ncbi:hypothetical protein [Ornithinibacillus sp. 179-J 7C1 HS]|uniref:hypothetical protein n=1 Tax=Ornithinibacillus sp. 179-J 7C1 HS TaxID=3142384 RepID=UPI0039A33DFC